MTQRRRRGAADCITNELKPKRATMRANGSPGLSHSQRPLTLTRNQLDVLEKWHKGELLDDWNNAVLALGHGRLRNLAGRTLDIGGSTGGGSRRVLDTWQPPDWRRFLEEQ